MEINEETPQDWQKNWAVDLKVMRLSDADRAYDKTGMHLVMVGLVEGKEVPLAFHLTKLDAINLALMLNAEVSREMTTWPNGYSDEERDEWFKPIRAKEDADAERLAAVAVSRRDIQQSLSSPKEEGAQE